ncbi:LysR substrate-binding domain-containing protein [Pseudomonas otitidis]|uniref:LysR family transcriptional regulator n=1 Tax=Metapseudomonas otitidis TaxID=319939 RepID=UPI00244C6809|nr:LysR family transcriptional regulator [Pseudomonas otitidis]MDH1105506.1 LysR substrate-binding domain-containing protein [Pseudomonas otitidis]MDH1158504.1 LysR substrate-binding domain-containing protein [Pseudomonas otitidis]MDH1162550.1 LysR substrate-binding domain-containing protein [Pseudomonas otitidis]
MNRNDLRRVDMNLLVIFEALMLEPNLTRVGEKLFLSQSTVSAALARLRDLFDDPLLIRSGRGMVPTSRAQEIFVELRPAMDVISAAVSRAKSFDPATSTNVFRLGLSDDAEFGLFPALLNALQEEAPNIVVVVRRANFLLMPALLASGEITVGVSYTTDLPANAKRRKLRDIGVKVLRGDDRPGPLTLDDYCARRHVMVSFSGDLSGNIDQDLARIGRSRQVVLAVPQFGSLRALLRGTEMIATVPDYAACTLVDDGSLRADDAPFEVDKAELSMVWSGAHDNDPAERWLRERIHQFMSREL